jgi:hypothetical protein
MSPSSSIRVPHVGGGHRWLRGRCSEHPLRGEPFAADVTDPPGRDRRVGAGLERSSVTVERIQANCWP